MIYIRVNEENVVTFQHFFPFDEKLGLGKSREELEQEGFFVDSIPEPQEIEGKIPVLKFNGTELYYEYVDRPLTPEEELEQLKERIEIMQQAMDELLLGGM
jgi:hypothetical protein